MIYIIIGFVILVSIAIIFGIRVAAITVLVLAGLSLVGIALLVRHTMDENRERQMLYKAQQAKEEEEKRQEDELKNMDAEAIINKYLQPSLEPSQTQEERIIESMNIEQNTEPLPGICVQAC